MVFRRRNYIRKDEDTPSDTDENLEVSEEEESEDEYVVEKILDHRTKKVCFFLFKVLRKMNAN